MTGLGAEICGEDGPVVVVADFVHAGGLRAGERLEVPSRVDEEGAIQRRDQGRLGGRARAAVTVGIPR